MCALVFFWRGLALYISVHIKDGPNKNALRYARTGRCGFRLLFSCFLFICIDGYFMYIEKGGAFCALCPLEIHTHLWISTSTSGNSHPLSGFGISTVASGNPHPPLDFHFPLWNYTATSRGNFKRMLPAFDTSCTAMWQSGLLHTCCSCKSNCRQCR